MDKKKELFIASNLRAARVSEDNISQAKFGKKFDLTRSNMNSYESGVATPQPNKLSEIANYLGITIEQLLYEDMSKILAKRSSNRTNNQKITSMAKVDNSLENDYREMYYAEVSKRADMQEKTIDRLLSLQEQYINKCQDIDNRISDFNSLQAQLLEESLHLSDRLSGFQSVMVTSFAALRQLDRNEILAEIDTAVAAAVRVRTVKGNS